MQGLLAIDAVQGDELISPVLVVLNTTEDDEPPPCVVHSKVEDLSSDVLVLVDVSHRITAEEGIEHLDLRVLHHLVAEVDGSRRHAEHLIVRQVVQVTGVVRHHLHFSLALPGPQLVLMQHERDECLVQVDFLLVRGATDVVAGQLMASHLVKRVPQQWSLNRGVGRVQVQVVLLKVIVFGFNHTVEVMSVSKERPHDLLDVMGQLIPLHEGGVERIVNEHLTVPCTVGEVRPIEAVRPIVVVNAGRNYRFLRVFRVAQVDVEGVHIECVTQVQKDLHVSKLGANARGLDHRIVDN
mmetsp:Transcript_9402/g.14351  ORF Transcript_9402/g.14351 Transcript_9402/m.14351 type:complete len:296 (-) Transcript_9402:2507-3394(-)